MSNVSSNSSKPRWVLRIIGAFVSITILSRTCLAQAEHQMPLSEKQNGLYLVNQSQLETSLLTQPRPPECPPCFNCNLKDFSCLQYGSCNAANGRCSCPTGFGGQGCEVPLCDSPAIGEADRTPRVQDDSPTCACTDGWTGINCNVCETNPACDSLVEHPAQCLRSGALVEQNYQMCNVTNRKIIDQLKDKAPQITIACNAEHQTCNFQFWIGQVESFYCGLDTCTFEHEEKAGRNTTRYHCDNIQCSCIPGRMLCGQSGSIDIGEFLVEEIKGPATLSSVRSSHQDTSAYAETKFEEPAMNDLIKSVFGDEYITLQCMSGECIAQANIPGYVRPIEKKGNPALVAITIAGCAVFIVLVLLAVFVSSRRGFTAQYGPIKLDSDDDSHDQNGILDDKHHPTSLTFDDVSYLLDGKAIVQDVQGVALPGQVTAIMGASGAGKTTLLDILARKNKRGIVSGQCYINDEKSSNYDDTTFRQMTGFVDQEDTMLPTLTVHETIMTSALLRLPSDMGVTAKEQRVREVEHQLGIWHIRHQMVGGSSNFSNKRGISGGERRRVGIACELVTGPSILFLDEPTSGLDAFNAYNVVEALVTLARTYQRTVIFTIHQPRSNIVALFDRLILLAQGQAVFSGPMDSCQEYFEDIGFPCPSGFNIADYLIDLTMTSRENASTAIDHGMKDHNPNNLSSENLGGTRSRSLADTTPDDVGTLSSSMRAVKSVMSSSNMSAKTDYLGEHGRGNLSSPSLNNETQRPVSHSELPSTNESTRPQCQRQNSTNINGDKRHDSAANIEATSHDFNSSIRDGSISFTGPDPRQRTSHKHNRGLGNLTSKHDAPSDDFLEPQQLDAVSKHQGDRDGSHNHPISSNVTNKHEYQQKCINASISVDRLVSTYRNSTIAQNVKKEISGERYKLNQSPGHSLRGINGISNTASSSAHQRPRIGIFRQFIILSQRTWRNLYRNPMLLLTHYAVAILLALLSGTLFYNLTDDIKGFQNRLGLFFFLLALFGFSTLTSLNVFSSERLLFVRERANGYYHPLAYYASKVIFDLIPLRLIPPIIMGVIIYPMAGLTPEWAIAMRFLLVLILFNLAAAAICLFIGIVFRDGAVANLIGSLVMLFSLLFAGLLLNHDAIPATALWLQSLSIFHYGFEALIVNEVKYLTLIDHKYGLDIEVPGASILSAFGFNNSGLWPDVAGLAIFGAAFLVIAYGAMHILLKEER